MKKLFNTFSKNNYLIIILLILPAISPLLHPGLPPTHDGEYHIIRFYQFFKAIAEGVIYPRWAADLNGGFGIPLFNYVYPFPNYFASLLHILGFNFIDAFKLNLFIGTIAGSIFFYKWTKTYLGEFGGLVSAVSYSYAPYRIVDTYIRGSVGEIWAMAFLPALFWSIDRLIQKKSLNFILLSGFFYSLIIFSHNILAVMFTLLILSYFFYLLIINKWNKKLIMHFVAVILLGLNLSAVFWLPALTEKNLVRGLEIYSVKEHFVEPYELILPSWGSGFSAGNLQNRMSFQIGIIPLIVVLISIILAIKMNKKSKLFGISVLILGWFMVSVFFMLNISEKLWDIIPIINYFQFPWRFLSITIIATSFLAGGVTSFVVNKKYKVLIGLVIILLTIISTINYTKPAYYHNRDDIYYISRKNFIHGTNSPGDLFNTLWFKKTDSNKYKIKLLNSTGKIIINTDKSTYKKYSIKSVNDSDVLVNIAYYPGWTVFQDGKKISLLPTDEGLIKFKVTKGLHIIEVKFLDTIIRSVAYALSIMTIFCVILLVFIEYKKKKI